MALITYEDKEFLNKNEEIADNRKVNDTDLNQIKNAINNLFPIGFIISVDNEDFDPNTYWGGTWERLKGKFIIGVDENDDDLNASGKIGGEKTHTLTLNEIPSHNHEFDGAGNTEWGLGDVTFNANMSGANQGRWKQTSYAGGGQAHNNMPPYYTAYQWIKTAM